MIHRSSHLASPSHQRRDLGNVVALIGGLMLFATTLGCQAHTIDSVRFANKAPVNVVNDRVHTEEKPADNPFVKMLYHYDGLYYKRLVEWTKMKPDRRAANVNSHDEVPDSTWFTNRIGVRELTVKEVADGPNQPGGPMLAKPWTIVSTKVGGVSPGFIIKDANGDGYLLKFDAKAVPEAETAADVISSRLLWAVGYNVAEDYIVGFTKKRSQDCRRGDGQAAFRQEDTTDRCGARRDATAGRDRQRRNHPRAGIEIFGWQATERLAAFGHPQRRSE